MGVSSEWGLRRQWKQSDATESDRMASEALTSGKAPGSTRSRLDGNSARTRLKRSEVTEATLGAQRCRHRLN